MHPEILPKAETALLEAVTPLAQSHGWTLAGGTAAALHLGHRISRDLDFFTSKSFSSERIIQELQRLKLDLSLQHQAEEELIVLVGESKLSVFLHPYPFIERTATFKGAAIAGILDIAAMKLIAISQRGKKRDFVDLYFILKDVPLPKIASVLVERYGKDRINPVIFGKSLTFFDDAEGDPDPQYCGSAKTTWPLVKKYFKSHFRQIVLDIQSALD